MPGASMLRVAVVSLLSIAAIGSIGTPAGAVTIFLPAQAAGDRAAIPGSDADAPDGAGAISRAAFLPIDDDSLMWSLLAGGVALIGTTMRRKRRMPSVTS